MNEGFLTNLDTAMLFWRTVGLYRIQKLEDRIALMRKITARKKAKYIRDVDTFTGKTTIVGTKRGPSHVSN